MLRRCLGFSDNLQSSCLKVVPKYYLKLAVLTYRMLAPLLRRCCCVLLSSLRRRAQGVKLRALHPSSALLLISMIAARAR